MHRLFSLHALLDPLPPGCVPLPLKVRKQDTKLGKPTAAVTTWLVEMDKGDIDDRHLAGSIARTAALAEILKLVEQGRSAASRGDSVDNP